MKTKFSYKLFILILSFSVFAFFTSCKTNSLAKSEMKAKNKIVLDSLYALENYKVDIEVMYPFNTTATAQVANALLINTGNTSSRIDVRGDGNFIEIRNDSVLAYLPFFGESRISGGGVGGRSIAIQLEEPLDELKKNINTDKGKLELEFNATQAEGDNDRYKIKIDLFANKNAVVDISPVYRTFIKYDGTLAKNNDEK